MKFRLLTLFILISIAPILGQNRTNDSLYQLLEKSEDPSERVAIQCKIAQGYTEIGDYKKAGEIADIALKQAIELRDHKGEGLAYYTLARLNQYMRDWDNALLYHYQAIQLFDEANAIEELAWSYLNMGIAFVAKKEYDRAIRYCNKALEAFKKINHKQGEAYSYLNLGYPLHYKGETEKALEQLEKCKVLCEEIKDQTGVGYVHNIRGDIYFEIGELDKALAENQACIEIRKTENNKRDFAIIYGRIAKIHLIKKELKKAEETLQLAEKAGLEIEAHLELRNLYMTYAELDSTKGNFKAAYDHLKASIDHGKVIVKEEREREVAAVKYSLNKEIEALQEKETQITEAYESELRECQQEASKGQGNTLLYIAGGIIALLALLLVRKRK